MKSYEEIKEGFTWSDAITCFIIAPLVLGNLLGWGYLLSVGVYLIADSLVVNRTHFIYLKKEE